MTETTSEQLGLSSYSPKQKERFAALCEKVRIGELSANQSYKYAQADGEGEDNKGFKGSLKEWIETAKTSGWLEPMNDLGAPKVESVQQPIIEEPKTNYVIPIVIGAVIAIALIYAIKKYSKD